MPDEGAAKRIGASLAQKAQKNLQHRAVCVKQVNRLLIPNRNAVGYRIRMLQVSTSLKM